MMNWIFSALGIAGLFLVRLNPAIAFFIWSGTSLYWLIWNIRCADYPQAGMFAAFFVANVIQYFRSKK